MEITFAIKGKDEADLEAAAKKVLVDFNDNNFSKWSWEIKAEATQDEAGVVSGWDGQVTAIRGDAQEKQAD